MRKIYLPELINLKINNFTLYPNGMNFSYDFIKGVNLVLGGNGMGKTTFVNIIKYSIIGHYKKQFNHTRTYKDRSIEKRILYPMDYFLNRMDDTVLTDGDPTVEITFALNGTIFTVTRRLDVIQIINITVDKKTINGLIIPQNKFEELQEESKTEYLQFKYEQLIEKYSGLNFDDLIFFVNEVLFFGENHNTILWNDGEKPDNVQNELFNKYFNSPELDRERQESQRQAKYYDSISRHRSEDIRAIKKVLDRVEKNKITPNSKEDPFKQIIVCKDELEKTEFKIKSLKEITLNNSSKASISQNRINTLSIKVSDLEQEINKAEAKLKSKIWEKLHPDYDLFIENIRNNHLCPMCNTEDEKLYERVINDSVHCFSCGSQFDKNEDESLNSNHKNLVDDYKSISNQIQEQQKTLKLIDIENDSHDKEIRTLESKKRNLIQKIRTLELQISNKNENNNNKDLQAFYEEIKGLESDKLKYQELSRLALNKAESISREIEQQIISNTSKFSALFSEYAENFLGVKCSLTFDKLTSGNRRFYPVIDGKTRIYEEELSESQRFFIDHSFRMSILSFFYSTPTFYIVETPDSSLDISYEENAANVFIRFLQSPNSLIITSNLNNSSFVNHIIDNNKDVSVSLVRLLDIAKKSTIQNTNTTLIEMYNSIKHKVSEKKDEQ